MTARGTRCQSQELRNCARGCKKKNVLARRVVAGVKSEFSAFCK